MPDGHHGPGWVRLASMIGGTGAMVFIIAARRSSVWPPWCWRAHLDAAGSWADRQCRPAPPWADPLTHTTPGWGFAPRSGVASRVERGRLASAVSEQALCGIPSDFHGMAASVPSAHGSDAMWGWWPCNGAGAQDILSWTISPTSAWKLLISNQGDQCEQVIPAQ